MHRSIATIDAPEFLNLQPLDLNPLMSSCEIKVFYIGENRNRSFITKEVATDMGKTLRGAPIVGYYKKEKEDFADHGHQIIMDDEGIKFNCLTVPYGFVAPDAKVWFQKFEDEDEFGNKITREYLMTTGYLWTGQFEEAKKALENEGRPHSMELDEESLDGHWAENTNTGIEFFIINDAIVSKLCILGQDVEPCFEGSSVTKPNVSTKFSLDENFTKTLFSMMQDLQFALKGGKQMENENNLTNAENTDVINNSLSTEGTSVAESNTSPVATDNTEEFAKENKEEEKKDDEKKDNEENEGKKKYAALEKSFTELQTAFSQLQARCEELVSFKNDVEDKKKDELIAKFYMLSDEDKADVIKNKSTYSLEDIEAKLSVICVRKKVNFDSEDTNKNDNTVGVTTYSINNAATSNLPDWIAAVKANENI